VASGRRPIGPPDSAPAQNKEEEMTAHLWLLLVILVILTIKVKIIIGRR
jgi:hypothetical protein